MKPSAVYTSPIEERSFTVDDSDRYKTTNGVTTGPSSYVLNAGQVDRDRPSDAKVDAAGDVTYLGRLRTQLTGLQDDINEFLTAKMEQAKSKKQKTEDEQRIQKEINDLLDGGDDDDEEE
ncbi:EKC/KEOPS complex subunit GON7 [Nakaseomyces bracarensis]|uniref:EKC/KEOPS complex subunit GON7 n=1 Tax=Nakaseomyces bracarensis TaxID=273131 RepID=A0ABR4NZX8_9SACH